MSGKCTGWILEHGPKVRAQRSVLITIGDAANINGNHAHPGLKAMVEGSLYSRSQVNRIVSELIEERWIEVEAWSRGPGHSTTYRVLMGREPSTPEPITKRPRKGAHGEPYCKAAHLDPRTAHLDPRTAHGPTCESSPTVLTTVSYNASSQTTEAVNPHGNFTPVDPEPDLSDEVRRERTLAGIALMRSAHRGTRGTRGQMSLVDPSDTEGDPQ